MTKEERQLAALHHIVHDYTNLVSSGTLLQTNLKPPINTHVQHAFLLNCRKMADFFLSDPEGDDVVAKNFLDTDETFHLPAWKGWGGPMNKQLAHLTYARVTRPKSWDGTDNTVLLAEFRTAWTQFRSKLKEPYRSKLEKEIDSKLGPGSEFRGLDLR